ncbi:MAG TPA: ABC transporter ATP-binding protein [Chryseosolibacter sp.]
MKRFVKEYFQTFSFFYSRLRYRVFVAFALNISVGLLDGLGLTMFLPLLQVVESKKEVDSGQLGKLGFIIDLFAQAGIPLTIVSVLAFMAVFFLLKGIAQYVNAMYRVTVQQYFVRRVRKSLVKSIVSLDYLTFLQTDQGKIQNSLTGEVDRVSRAYQSYFLSFQFAVLVAIYIIFAFLVNAEFALLVCSGGFLTNLIYHRIYQKTRKSSRKLTEDAHGFQGLLFEFVLNLKYLKATGLNFRYADKLDEKIEQLESNNKLIGKLTAIVTAAREPMVVIIISGLIYLQVEVLGAPLAPILISLLFFYRALTYLMMMQTQRNLFLTVSGSLESLSQFSDQLLKSRESLKGKKPVQFSDSIELRDVTVKIGQSQILNNVSATFRKNELVAIVGESGSGKSTLVNLVAGLINPESGEVRIDNVPMPEIDVLNFRKQIGYIAQEPVVFNDTIKNNVTLWDGSADASVLFNNALRAASADSFVSTLENGENTVIGATGVSLSGGQRQRIAIARELYKRPPILILDEATSSLDAETESVIRSSVEKLKGTCTIFLISHRLSTIRQADKVLLMEQGRIVACDSYLNLARDSARFSKMLQYQLIAS